MEQQTENLKTRMDRKRDVKNSAMERWKVPFLLLLLLLLQAVVLVWGWHLRVERERMDRAVVVLLAKAKE